MAQLWTENIHWEPELEIDAESFNAWVRDVLPITKDMTPMLQHVTAADHTKIPVGPFELVLREFDGLTRVPRFFFGTALGKVRQSLETYYGGQTGIVLFDGSVYIPILHRLGDAWMSLTPMEIISQRAGMRRMRGKVLVGGLGLGWFTRRALERKQTSHVTVVEKEPDVARVFGENLKKEFGDKLTIIVDDVYNLDPFAFDSVAYDIWQGANDAEDDRRFLTIANYHDNVWGWGRGWRSEVADYPFVDLPYINSKRKEAV